MQPDLTLPGHPEVHVVGDMISLDKLPGVAQVAIQGGRFAAEQIKRDLARQPRVERFTYHDKGSMATISRYHAVADLGKVKVTGFLAWVMWLVVHLAYIVGFKSRLVTTFSWVVSFLGKGRAQRVATQQQVYGRLALEKLGPDFEVSQTGGLNLVDDGDLAGARDVADGAPIGSDQRIA